MTPSLVAEVQDSLRQTQQAFLEIVAQVDEGVLYHRPAADSWTLAEALVHIAEARQFFAGQLGQALASPGSKIGRTLDDAGRLKNIEDHGHDSADQIRQMLVASHRAMLEALEAASAADPDSEIEHVSSGRQTLATFLQNYFVGHDRTHVKQARELLAGRPAAE